MCIFIKNNSTMQCIMHCIVLWNFGAEPALGDREILN